jgi:serine/threonine protein kinase
MNINLINSRYTLDKKIGSGSFGEVFIGYDKVDGHPVGIKLEDAEKKHILKHEYDVYQDILAVGKLVHIPKIYWYGVLPDARKALVMQFLGNSLEYLFNKKCRGSFSVKTVLMIGIQGLKLLHSLHECNYIHRDIKPDNFLTSLPGETERELYLIDFGLAKRYKSPERVHLKQANGKSIVGTARYSSINSHLGIELSRRDDLESLGYMLLYFLKGKLPWQGIPADNKHDKYAMIGKMKQECPITELCAGIPQVFHDYLSYARSLEFKEKPNYKYLHDLFVKSFTEQGFQWNGYDWDSTMMGV